MTDHERNLKRRQKQIIRINGILASATFIEKKPGHHPIHPTSRTGYSKTIKNPYSIYSLPDGKKIALVTCTGVIPFFLIDVDEWYTYKVQPDKKTPVTWYVNTEIRSGTDNMYVNGMYMINGMNKRIRLHQLILQWFGRGNKDLTVDHDDKCTMNNMKSNLNLKTKKEQIENRGARKIQKNATLPEGFDRSLKRECISWNSSVECFKIQCHQYQKLGLAKEVIRSTQSKKVSWQDKWKEINIKLEDLDRKYEIYKSKNF